MSSFKDSGISESKITQESPPEWTQEAYHPPHSKCSLCWGGGGYPIQSWGEVPHPDLPRGNLAGVPPPHHQDLAGVPSHHLDLAGVIPPTISTWLGYPPPPVKVWTDKQTENSTFPHLSDAGGNKEPWNVPSISSSVNQQSYNSATCTAIVQSANCNCYKWSFSKELIGGS